MQGSPDPLPVLVAGAGIAGLTAALAFARAGWPVVVLERRTRVEETGAGIQVSPNAAHVLQALGIGQALSRVAAEPERLRVRRGDTGDRIVEMPLGAAMRERFGAPYFVVHRADLQTVLLDAVRGEPGVRLVFGRTVASAVTHPDHVAVSCDTASGPETFNGRLLVGADGLWSRVAPVMGDSSEPDFTGNVAWRGLVPAEAAPPPFRRMETGLWLGSGAHVVHYPIRGGRSVNVVAVIADRDAEPGWSRPGDADMFRRRFRGWSPELLLLFAAVEEWHVWSLFDRPPRRVWAAGRVALMGDAAHPVLPFLAQGGALAIEDAAVLAEMVLARPDDLPGALAAYSRARVARARKVQQAARFNARAYHLPGPLALPRDLILRRLGGEGMLKRYAWLYGWTPDAG